MIIVLQIIEVIVFLLIGFNIVYLFVFALAARLRPSTTIAKANRFAKIAVLIPAYKEDQVIISTALHSLEQAYPKEFYTVYVIGDSLQENTIGELQKLPLNFIEVRFDKSTKAKALNTAFERIPSSYDIAVILDADNIMEKQFLMKVNNAYQKGYRAIQGHRTAKNLNTPFALLDAISEQINNHVFRRGLNALGFSSAVIGSGMAIQFDVLKKELKKNAAVGGFDKILQLDLIEQGFFIKYLHGAYVYDEKIERVDHFRNQRTRWLSSQIKYFKKRVLPSFKQLLKGNVDYFNLAFLANAQLPRVILLALATFLFLLSILLQPFLLIGVLGWGALFGLLIVTFALSIPKYFYRKSLLKALLQLPEACLAMIQSLFKLKGADSKFIHTPHSNTHIENKIN